MGNSAHQAIVDIGSNSIRLVVFGSGNRNPPVLYDDKVVAGLGRGVVARGALDRRSMRLALETLERYAALLRLIKPRRLRVVATAAVRDASNGVAFLAQVRALGLPAELLSGEEEARAAAWGVIAAHPGADGLIGDLGGGSLELARIKGEQVHHCASFRLGIMPVAKIRAGGRGRLRRTLKEVLAPLDWLEDARGRRLYLVGGAWRALGKLHAELAGVPMTTPIPSADARLLKATVREMGPRRLAAIPGISAARAAQLPHASALLSALIAECGPRDVEVSLAGLRDGLLLMK